MTESSEPKAAKDTLLEELTKPLPVPPEVRKPSAIKVKVTLHRTNLPDLSGVFTFESVWTFRTALDAFQSRLLEIGTPDTNTVLTFGPDARCSTIICRARDFHSLETAPAVETPQPSTEPEFVGVFEKLVEKISERAPWISHPVCPAPGAPLQEIAVVAYGVPHGDPGLWSGTCVQTTLDFEAIPKDRK